MDGERDPATTPGSRSPLVDASVSPVILEVVDFSKSFGPVRAVRSLSLDVREGEVHAICGHNGAGKSTLVKALVGLVKPDEGEIRFDGKEISLRNPHDAQAHGIALVNQELSLVPELSVAVGSSRMSRRASRTRRRAISTSCRSPIESDSTAVPS